MTTNNSDPKKKEAPAKPAEKQPAKKKATPKPGAGIRPK